MIHYLIGDLGHLFVLTSFVTSLVTFFLYFKATRTTDEVLKVKWTQNGRVGFFLHSLAVLGIIISLFGIIYNHYFEYNYAYAHSSRQLPGQYMVSCFWEGQEGSFLLWMFWQAVIGIALIFTQKSWEAPVMSVFALVQAFLASMILGIVIPGLSLKIGSSPFILLRDAMDDPIFKMQPDFIPANGRGLNPLLQNYWMVIHPPTLFLGFSLTLVPFAFCMAGLWFKKYTEWIKPAIPWTLMGGSILGLGILMGGYWAYETLSFGGYWNWDPVENAVYVPWLILIASVHTLMLYKTTRSGLRTSMILVISVFILILYSTFLTRSGILGEASVHSFTDLGLSGQLLIYLLFFSTAAIALLVWRWKSLPATEKEVATFSKEFWIFLGVAALCLMGFQVLLPTSFPVVNKILSGIGISSNLAPPANSIVWYSRIQLWFAAVVAVLSATTQVFWWKKIEAANWKKELLVPILFSLLIAAIVVNALKIYTPAYILLVFAGTYIIFSNLRVLYSAFRIKPSISGGAVAHIGIGLMLIGILFSSGYSKIVSLNVSGMIISKELSTEFNRDNLLLFIHEPRTMAGYEIEYLGERLGPRKVSGYIKKTDVALTNDPYRVLALREIIFDDKRLFAKGDTIEIDPENTFYEIQLRKNGRLAATLFPRVQQNPSMGMLASPDISRGFSKDLYTHVSAPMNREVEPDWSTPEEVRIKIGQQFFVNDFVAVLEDVSPVRNVMGITLEENDVAAQARIRLEGKHESYFANPVFIIQDAQGKADVGVIPSEINDLGVRITLMNIHPNEEEFTLSLSTRQKDWVIIKAMEKPYINVLWLGTGLLFLGFVMAMARRFKESRRPV